MDEMLLNAPVMHPIGSLHSMERKMTEINRDDVAL